MKPIIRLQSIVFSITTAIIYFLWGYLNTLITENPYKGLILGALIALGTYRFVLDIVTIMFNNNIMMKKFIFKNYYLEGTWIGCYVNKTGDQDKVIYYIEDFEQSFDKLIVRGRSFYENESYKGSWISENISLDVIKGKITYNYQTDMIDNTFINPGQAVFNFVRKKENVPPYKMYGFTSDLYSNNKVKSLEIKLENNNKKINNDSYLLEKAKELYKDNENYFK